MSHTEEPESTGPCDLAGLQEMKYSAPLNNFKQQITRYNIFNGKLVKRQN